MNTPGVQGFGFGFHPCRQNAVLLELDRPQLQDELELERRSAGWGRLLRQVRRLGLGKNFVIPKDGDSQPFERLGRRRERLDDDGKAAKRHGRVAGPHQIRAVNTHEGQLVARFEAHVVAEQGHRMPHRSALPSRPHQARNVHTSLLVDGLGSALTASPSFVENTAAEFDPGHAAAASARTSVMCGFLFMA